VASQVATVDQISAGRAILTIGLGDVNLFKGVRGEPLDRATRAWRLDEGIDLIKGFWAGDPVFEGNEYAVNLTGLAEFEVEGQVRADIPIWVTGVIDSEKSMQRVLNCSGIIPLTPREHGFAHPEPSDIGMIRAWLRSHGDDQDKIAIVAEGETDGPFVDAENFQAFAEAKATWWLETRWSSGGNANPLQDLRQRIVAG
jgi:hypothetical protein